MSSNLSCVGLACADSAELGQLVQLAAGTARSVGHYNGVDVRRWQDPSGAGLILGWQGPTLVDLLPTYAATAGGLVADCALINGPVASAAIVDSDGEKLTAMAFEVEEYRRLKASGAPVSGPVRITALGVDVTVHADAEAFAGSPASLLDPNADLNEDPPAHFAERGWAWPPRMGSESFISQGVFGDPANSTAHARLAGLVISSRSSACGLTGQTYSVSRVRTVGFETDLCLAGSDHPTIPAAGNIISGTVFLVGSIEPALSPLQRGRWPRLRRQGRR